MRNSLSKVFIITILPIFTFVYGVGVGHLHLFPFKYMSAIKSSIITSKQKNNGLNQEQRRISLFEEFNPKPDIVFLGDSLTELGLWNEFFPTVKLANRGVGGDTTKDVLKRLNSIFSLEPKVVLIMLGSNDFAQQFSVDYVYDNYIKIVQSLHKKNIQVVVQSTIQCSSTKIRCRIIIDQTNKLNQLLERYCLTSAKCLFIKLSELSDSDKLTKEIAYDGQHLTGKGYRKWVEALQSSQINFWLK